MKNITLFLAFLLTTISASCQDKKPANTVSPDSKKQEIVYLTDQTFKEKVFNYSVNQKWKYEGAKPCIVDFYADWCGPCRRVSPILEEFAKDYSGQIIVYKVNTDKEQALSSKLGIQSLPTILFIPVSGEPKAVVGAYPKEELLKILNELLLNKK